LTCIAIATAPAITVAAKTAAADIAILAANSTSKYLSFAAFQGDANCNDETARSVPSKQRPPLTFFLLAFAVVAAFKNCS
jgi:hypothetical protein